MVRDDKKRWENNPIGGVHKYESCYTKWPDFIWYY